MDESRRSALLAAIDQAAEKHRAELIEISHHIHDNPELFFKEFKASTWLSEALEKAGFAVKRGVAGMETAFRADWAGSGVGKKPGEGPAGTAAAGGVPTVAILGEYDALLDVGHGCGHNIIGTAAIGAGIVLKEAYPELPGRIAVMGCPAEEDGGGKVIMLKAGLFDDVDAALMIHPTTGESKIGGASLATTTLNINFKGKPSHAAGDPYRGINALDAVVQTYVNVSTLRQHVTPDVRMHCLITKGGSVINIVPEEAEIQYLLRANTREGVRDVTQRVKECAEGAARATRATVTFVEQEGYEPRKVNRAIGDVFRDHFRRLGETMLEGPEPSGGSTDFGDISQKMPAANAYPTIGHKGTPSHSRELAAFACSAAGDEALMKSVKAMAASALDIVISPDLLARAKREFGSHD
ncbi:MAG: M20 family metallopeptidase [Bacillota bacterium]